MRNLQLSQLNQGLQRGRGDRMKILAASRRIAPRILAQVLVVLIVLASLLIPQSPMSQIPTAEAQTSSSTSYRFGDCSFRRATGPAAPWGNSLCWIDQPEMPTLEGTLTGVVKNIGRYQLRYDLEVTQTDGSSSDRVINEVLSDSINNRVVFGNSHGGSEWFNKYAGDTGRPIVKASSSRLATAWGYRYHYRNISVIDRTTNLPVTNGYRLVVAEAESTTQSTGGEAFSVDSASTDAMSYTRLTPSGFDDACSHDPFLSREDTFGRGTEDYTTAGGSNSIVRDFVCREYHYVGDLAGSFLVGADSPTDLNIAMYAYGSGSMQGFALGIDLSQMAGGATVTNTQLERDITGNETSFDFKMGLRNGSTNTTVPLTNGNYSLAARRLQPLTTPGTEPQQEVGAVAQDSQVFSSTGTGNDATKTLSRYKPTWRCTLGNTQQTITEGQVPTGFTLNNNQQAGRSELVVRNRLSQPISCNVTWEPRFQNASLRLAKTVDGTASGFTDVQQRRFTFNHQCEVPAAFTKAYPTNRAVGTHTMQSAYSHTVLGLPAGATCTLTETFENGAAAGPGQNHQLTWSQGTTSTGTVPTSTITLSPGLNSVNANNRYDFRPGTMQASENLSGNAVADFTSPRAVQVQLVCADTGYSRTLSFNAVGGETMSGSVGFEDIPVDQDCLVRPLSEVTPEEAARGISITDQTVRFNGQELSANANGAYPLRLADYAQGTTPTSANLQIDTEYSYPRSDVFVGANITGPAGDIAAQDSSLEFPINYRCEVPGEADSLIEGTLMASRSANEPSVIEDVIVGSECVIWADEPQSVDNIDLDRIEVFAGHGGSSDLRLSNEDARTQPILTVVESTDPMDNHATMSYHYNNLLGTVSVEKVVQDNGILVGLPDSFTLNYQCGPRGIELADGQLRSVNLTGSLVVNGGSITDLVYEGENADLVNDQGGIMGVPYGNTCTFQEETPDLSVGGISWSGDAASAAVEITAPQNQTTITNTFDAAGDGVTISHSSSGVTALAENVTYELQCVDGNGLPLVLPLDEATFTLGDGITTHSIDATHIPEGSECVLTETSNESGERTNDAGITYGIDRDVTVNVNSGQGTSPVNAEFNDNEEISEVRFTVGPQTVINAGHVYNYIRHDLSASKSISYSPDRYMSDDFKTEMSERLFRVDVVCRPPNGESPISFTAQLGELSEPAEFSEIPEGSDCLASETAINPPAGIDITQDISVAGTTERDSHQFIFTGSENIDFINTFSRRLATLNLTNAISAPFDIEEAMDGDTRVDSYEPEEIYHSQNFNVVCRDATDGPAIGEFSASIAGNDSVEIPGVPVGTLCNIEGDNFDDLDLEIVNARGTTLETYLSPQQAEWRIVGTDGAGVIDSELAGGESSSNAFRIADDPEQPEPGQESYGNALSVGTTYDYRLSKIQVTSELTVPTHLVDTLVESEQEIEHLYHLMGVGYHYSLVEDENGELPTTVRVEDFETPAEDNGDGTSTLTYTSPAVSVPLGAWLQVEEINVTGVPAELEHSIAEPVVTGYARGETTDGQEIPAEEVSTVTLVNEYEHREVPVILVAIQDGYLNSLMPDPNAQYDYTLVCRMGDEQLGEGVIETFSLNETNSVDGVDVSAPPRGGRSLNIPVGTECEITVTGSALSPRTELEVFENSRAPYMAFGTWNNAGAADDSNLVTPLDSIPMEELDSRFRDMSFNFEIPADAEADATSGNPYLTIAGEVMHQRAHVDVAFTKESQGKAGEGRTFNFTTGANENFQLSHGQTHVIENVPVNSDVAITEFTEEGDIAPVIEFGAHGSLVVLGETNQQVPVPETENEEEAGENTTSSNWNFHVLPVDDVNDLAQSGERWSLTGLNLFPGLSIDKKIEGAPLSFITGAIADTAMLADDAEFMEFSYTITNDGAMPLTDFQFAEPGLARRTITNGEVTETIGEDGVIPSTLCTAESAELAPGESFTCTFSVDISNESMDEAFSYSAQERGTVTVTATTVGANAGTQLEASDSYGAMRMTGIFGSLLPDTGMQSLVWLLLLGLALVGYGLWRYLRNKDEDLEGEYQEASVSRGVDE